ncbi:MAG: zinc-dependent peptidase [Cytophagales bacterium]|nr:zinc-dependent peptidase [Cytophagales bacterium]
METALVVLLSASFLIWLASRFYLKNSKIAVINNFPNSWRELLEKHVCFYRKLGPEKKEKFEKRILTFLNQKEIIGKGTSVELLDRLLIASSAVIPLLGFSEWHYPMLEEIILLPESFSQHYDPNAPQHHLAGMVGTGELAGKMFLSRKALRSGFESFDERNVGLHEFLHLVDSADGRIDGIPQMLIQNRASIPWLRVVHEEMQKLSEGKSDFREYARSSQEEFLTVAGEYFFEKPEQLAQRHPVLYAVLREVFNQ